jgi:A/G-specific adenine glycosylase
MDKIQFQKSLLDWFYENKREMPWRKNKEAYRIWISEVMLQQTKVDTVIPYFNRFIEKFPTVETLANAKEEEVLKCWEGLGYYSRARNLIAGAKQVVNDRKGIFPNEKSELQTIKGIGAYTAGAIASIAFNKKEAAVDGNVMRVYSRLFTIWDDIAKEKSKKMFEEKVIETIDENNAGDFNQAIMELGALICKPQNSSCIECPMKEFCEAYANNAVEELPVKSKKKPPAAKNYSVFIIKNERDKFLIEKREETLLKNMYQFVTTEVVEEDFNSYFKENYGLTISSIEKIDVITHIFTHLKWMLNVYHVNIEHPEKIIVKENQSWKTLDEIKKLPVPVAYQKIVNGVITN